MIFAILFVLCVVNIDGAVIGESCSKNGVRGICMPFRQCPDAQNDAKNKIKPQHCEYTSSTPIVCCISPASIIERYDKGNCILPPYPKHGTYVANVPGKPGDSYDVFIINVTCSDGYVVDRLRTVLCQDGWWSEPMPKCTQCGIISEAPRQLRSKAEPPAAVPWHAAVYTKKSDPHRLVCGGSLVSATAVLTTAHCLWNYNDVLVQPASEYAVAVGKLYPQWDHPCDAHAQKSDVLEIYIPETFEGEALNYASDIAVLKLATAVQINAFVRPVCLDSEDKLAPGSLGKIASWNILNIGGRGRRQEVQEFPYVDPAQCSEKAPKSFRDFLTVDKLCVIGKDSTQVLCRGNSGVGWAFPREEAGVTRYYLRGIASTSVFEPDSSCSRVVGFTSLPYHGNFIKQHL